ncbi:MAG TPA: helix-turn-helix transcriptional regulator [Caulobacteraceae bacterium]|jgi:transcriptional regulator with XRE-family HTH domain|nr:helix-turn-helix transcriptional regulator [Caulobacteraceae bacterium]
MAIEVLVGRNVRRLRKGREMTQEGLAERAEVSQQYVSDLERGRNNPTILQLQKLATALGVRPHELLLEPPKRSSAQNT